MPRFLTAGQPAKLIFPFEDASGNKFTVLDASYRVVDETDAELVPATELTPAGTEVEVDVAADINDLPVGKTRAKKTTPKKK